jgi:hypothetical protein
MDVEPILDVDDLRVVGKLDCFHRWFSGDTGSTGPLGEIAALPAVLVWALGHPECFGQRFQGRVDADNTLHCFDECGDAFKGYVDGWRPGDENPTVVFRFLGEDAHQPSRRLADLVIGAYFETIAFEANEISDSETHQPSDQHLVWHGDYLYLDEPVRVWVDGELVVLLVPPVSNVPVAIRRARGA